MGGGFFYKFKNILLTDVKKFNIYLLLIVSILIIGSVGYTSYSLFSYEVYSDSIYVSFKDSEKPVCVIGEPAVSLMEKSSTTTFEMNCTDNYTVADKDLTTSNFTKTGDITVTSVTKEKVGKAMKYVITVTSGTTGGIASIKLNTNAVTDSVGNSNAVSNTSEVFVRVTCDAMEEDVSGANSPEVSLASNMIPVCYNGAANLWVKADSTNTNTDYPWYSYTDKKWANAVTVTEENGTRDDLVDAEVGTPVPMSRINTMWVWIPRFNAKMVSGQAGAYNSTAYCSYSAYSSSQSTCQSKGYSWYNVGYNNPGAFDITFVDKETSAHDAFTFGEEIAGFWIGKFENSSDITCSASNQVAVGSGCNLKTIRPKIIPNATSWRGAMVSTFFYDIQKMTLSGNQYGYDAGVDTHMLKNNEWGAVTYLTQSIYGRCSSSTSCSEVGINNNSNYKTGYGAPAGSSSSSSTTNTYNTTRGMNASTTGNIYGVYDMSGGAYEYVMGVYTDGTKLWSGYSNGYYGTSSINNHSGFNGWLRVDSSNYSVGIDYPDDKYYNLYTTESAYTSAGLQHAMIETKEWYGDIVSFVDQYGSWVVRSSKQAHNGGIFYVTSGQKVGSYGRSDILIGSRSALTIN